MEWGSCETKCIEDEPIYLRPCVTIRVDAPPQHDEYLRAGPLPAEKWCGGVVSERRWLILDQQ